MFAKKHMNMHIRNIHKKTFVCISVIASLLSSCVMDFETNVHFKNCTNDTLFVGVSSYNNIDSAYCLLKPLLWYNEDSRLYNNKDYCLWNDNHAGEKKIYPDSVGLIIESMLFDRNHTDTCFFFLLRNEDVKNHSWDEIRSQKLYGVWIITKNKDGKYKRNIKKEDIITY